MGLTSTTTSVTVSGNDEPNVQLSELYTGIDTKITETGANVDAAELTKLKDTLAQLASACPSITGMAYRSSAKWSRKPNLSTRFLATVDGDSVTALSIAVDLEKVTKKSYLKAMGTPTVTPKAGYPAELKASAEGLMAYIKSLNPISIGHNGGYVKAYLPFNATHQVEVTVNITGAVVTSA